MNPDIGETLGIFGTDRHSLAGVGELWPGELAERADGPHRLARAVEPGELGLPPTAPRLVCDDPGVGSREGRGCGVRVQTDVLGDREGLLGEAQRLRVKWSREQGPVALEQEVTRRRVDDVRVGVEEELSFAAVEGGDVDGVLFGAHQAALNEIEEALPVRQENGPSVTELRLRELRDRRGLAAGGRDAMDRVPGARRKEDDPLAIPRSPSAQ